MSQRNFRPLGGFQGGEGKVPLGIGVRAEDGGGGDGGPGVSDGLVRRYTFDEGSGSTAGDSVGDNDATLVSGGWSSQAQQGDNSVLLDRANNDYLTAANFSLQPFTITAWHQTADLGTDSNVIWYVAGTGLGVDNPSVFYDNEGAADQWSFSLSLGATPSIEESVSSVEGAGNWRLTVAKYDGSTATLTIYDTNGSEIGSATGSENDYNPGDGTFFIGAETGPTEFWDGRIDDMRFYNRAISDSEEQEIANLNG